MKRIICLLLALVFSICLYACNPSNAIDLKVEIEDIDLSDLEEKVTFDIDLDNEELLINIKIKELSILYSFNETNKETLLKEHDSIKLEISDINVIEEKEYSINFDSSKYNSDLSIIVLIELTDDSKIYSNLVNINIFDLAKREYKDNQIAANIYYGFIINEISLTIDLNKTSLEGEEDKYTYTYSNPKYEIIVIVITLKENYNFSENFTLKLNDEIVKAKDYKIEGKVLTYEFEDPNWTEIY